MLRLYLTRTPPDALNLPTATFTSTEGDVFASATDDDAYSAPELGQQEVLYGGAGRSRIVLGDDVRRSALAEDPDHL
jgi:large subunit ribosomal protein L44